MTDPMDAVLEQAERDGLHDYPVEFLQHLIETGEGWMYEGALSSAVAAALDDGRCVLGTVAHRDYHGTVVPARSEVPAGAKGSLAYANARRAERGEPILVERADGSVGPA